MSGEQAEGGRRRSMLVVALVLALLSVSACGARWTDEQADIVAARDIQGAGGGGADRSVDDSSVTTTQDTGDEDGTSRTTVATGGTGGGGTASAAATGGGDGGPEAGAASGGGQGALPCAAPTDAPGVTDGEIAVGTIQSLSGPVPGLGASNLAAIQSYVAFRNATGGVCGRQITLNSGDDGGDNGRYRTILGELEPQILALVAGTAGGADGGVSLAEAENLPLVGSSITTENLESPVYRGINPSLDTYDREIGKYRFLRERGVTKGAVVYINAAASPLQGKREISLMEAAGIEVVNEQALPLSTLNYDSAARAVANSGAEYLVFVHAAGPSASMAQSMAGTGYDGLLYSEYIVAYGSEFPDLAGSAAEDTVSWLQFLPVEDGGRVPEHAAFLQWMRRIAPGAAFDSFAGQGWGGAKLLFDTIESLDGPISRDAVLAKLAATGAYDADGLIGEVDVGARIAKGCYVGVVFRGGAWQRLVPADSGFLC